MNLDIVPVASITTICYLLGMLCKAADHFPDKYIPVAMGILGALLGMAAWLSIPAFPADSWLAALEVGVASGLASTGVNQIWKQITKEESSDEG